MDGQAAMPQTGSPSQGAQWPEAAPLPSPPRPAPPTPFTHYILGRAAAPSDSPKSGDVLCGSPMSFTQDQEQTLPAVQNTSDPMEISDLEHHDIQYRLPDHHHHHHHHHQQQQQQTQQPRLPMCGGPCLHPSNQRNETAVLGHLAHPTSLGELQMQVNDLHGRLSSVEKDVHGIQSRLESTLNLRFSRFERQLNSGLDSRLDSTLNLRFSQFERQLNSGLDLHFSRLVRLLSQPGHQIGG